MQIDDETSLPSSREPTPPSLSPDTVSPDQLPGAFPDALMSMDDAALIDELVRRAREAQRVFARFTQSQVDDIVRRFALSVHTHALELARLAVEETGMGKVEHKIRKNKVKAELIYRDMASQPSRGVIRRDVERGLIEIAEPVGVVCAVTPVTNPIVTPMCNAMIALKAGNAVVFAPHPKAQQCVARTVELLQRDIEAAGAPRNLLQVVPKPSKERTQRLMAACDLVLATGGSSMVDAAYGSGTPAYGVGPGNVPVVVDVSADVDAAARAVMTGKTFDHGLICASEQAVIALPDNADALLNAFARHGAYVASGDEKKALERVMFESGHPAASIIGAPATQIAELAGVDVPDDTTVLLVEESDTGHAALCSLEKLSPVLAFYRATDFDDAIRLAQGVLAAGGLGHTAGIHSEAETRVEHFAMQMPVSRVIVNQPTATAAGGSVHNNLVPTTTLGCGTWGGNVTTDNISVKHVMNVKRVAYKQANVRSYRTFRVPSVVHGVGALDRLRDVDAARAAVVTDSVITGHGITHRVVDVLSDSGKEVRVIDDVPSDPAFDDVLRTARTLADVDADLIVAVGGGSILGAAKAAWAFYEHPSLDPASASSVPMNLYTRIEPVPRLGDVAQLIAVPTTSGTGAEVNGTALIRDDATGQRRTLFSHHMIPTEALLDPTLTYTMPRDLAAKTGYEAFSLGVEAFAASEAEPLSEGTAREAVRTLFAHLPASIDGDRDARARVHFAATSAGIASQNAGLGITNSLAAQLSSVLDVAYGTACAILLPRVIAYNTGDPEAAAPYTELATALGTPDLAAAARDLATSLGLPSTLTDAGVDADAVRPLLDDVAAQAYLSPHTDANPRRVDIADLRSILDAAMET